jgi:acyl-CoA thioesterase I
MRLLDALSFPRLVQNVGQRLARHVRRLTPTASRLALLFVFAACLTASLTSCTGDANEADPPAASGPAPAESGGELEPLPHREGSAPEGPEILFLGTSLTEGLGLESPREEAWPAVVGRIAGGAGIDVRIRNAGLSGETSAGALRRVAWVLDPAAPPAVFVLETGANDGLRGLPVEALEANLDSIFAHVSAVAPGARLVLAGMEAPTNLGPAYSAAFREVFPRVARRWDAELIPFLLDGVAGEDRLNQPDRIHPTAEGHARIGEVAWPRVRAALERP